MSDKQNAIQGKLFRFSKTLKSLENNPAKKFTDYPGFQQKNIKRKYNGPIGDKYKENLKKAKKNKAIQDKRTVKPGQGKLKLPSQKPGSVKAPTIKPASSTMKIKAPAPKEKKVGGDKGRWLDHVNKFKKDNPNMSYKEVLVEAKKTYVSVKKIKAPKKQVGVVKAPETTEKKPRKLTKRQLELKFYKGNDGDSDLKDYGKDKFEEWYSSNIKGKRFKDNAEIEAKLNEYIEGVKGEVGEVAKANRAAQGEARDKAQDKVKSEVNSLVGEKGAAIIFSDLLFASDKDRTDRYQSYQGPLYGSRDIPYAGRIMEDPKWSKEAVSIAKMYKKLDGYLGKSPADWLEEYKKEGQNIKTGKEGVVWGWNYTQATKNAKPNPGELAAKDKLGRKLIYDDKEEYRRGDGRGGYAKGMSRSARPFDYYMTMEDFYKLIRKQMKKAKKNKQ